MTEPSISARIEHRLQDEVHKCIRPGCRKRARIAYHVDGPMRLAGRDFMPGEFVDLCPDDDMNLRSGISEATALGYGGPFERFAREADENKDPLARFREWPE